MCEVYSRFNSDYNSWKCQKIIFLLNGINLYEIYLHFPVTKKIYLIQTYIFYGNLTKEFICCQSKLTK